MLFTYSISKKKLRRCFICYVQVFFNWQQIISTGSIFSYNCFYNTKIMYIKKVTYITVKMGAFISYIYTGSHLFSIKNNNIDM